MLLLCFAVLLPNTPCLAQEPPVERIFPRILNDPTPPENGDPTGLRIQDPVIAGGVFTGSVVNPSETHWHRISVTLTALAHEEGDVLWERTLELGDIAPGGAVPLNVLCPEGPPRPGYVRIAFRATAAPPLQTGPTEEEQEPETHRGIDVKKQADGSLRLIAR